MRSATVIKTGERLSSSGGRFNADWIATLPSYWVFHSRLKENLAEAGFGAGERNRTLPCFSWVNQSFVQIHVSRLSWIRPTRPAEAPHQTKRTRQLRLNFP